MFFLGDKEVNMAFEKFGVAFEEVPEQPIDEHIKQTPAYPRHSQGW